MTEPWGHKVTFVVYVPGDAHIAEMVIRQLANEADRPYIDFAGARMEEVQDEPLDQVAT